MANYGKYSVANRLLLLRQYLEANAGRNHVVSRQELEDYLRGHEITVEKRTIYSDLAALEGFCGLHLEYDPHKKGYRLLNPPFELSEIRMMVDCIQAAPFITEEEANALTAKIRSYAPTKERGDLYRYVDVRDRVTKAEESILRKVDIIQEAFQKSLQIRFRYYKVVAKRQERREYYRTEYGDEYITVNPRTLVYEDSRYFLEYYSVEEELRLAQDLFPSRFEVARMDNLELLDEIRQKADMRPHDEALALAEKLIFGKETPITIRFRNNIVQDVLEQFGRDTPIIPVDENHFQIVVHRHICPEDAQALLSFGCFAKVIAPPEAVNMMNEYIRDMEKLYETGQEPYYVLSQKELDALYMLPEADEDDFDT